MPPTSYTPDPTATQSPAAQPAPNNAPVVSLPASGDGVTAASVAQAYKALADQEAWIKLPRAAASVWDQPIMQYKNARLQTRFIFDHLGYPAGKLHRWSEDWSDVSLGNKGNTDTVNGPWGKRWNFGLPGTGTNASITAFGPDSTWPLSSRAIMAVDATTVSSSTFEQARANCLSDNDRALYLQWDMGVDNSSDLGTCELSAGIHLNSQLFDTAGAFTAIASGGAAFVKRATDTNWQAWDKPVSGSATFTDTGVAGNTTTIHSFRVEIIGSNVADDSAARVNFFVDGSLLVQRVLSLGTHDVRAFARLARTASGTVAPQFSVGVMEYCHNLRASSVMM